MNVALAPRAGRLDLPPAFSLLSPPGPADAFALACDVAGREGAGALVWPPHEDRLDVAVVLEPDEGLREARRAFLIGMAALADAIGSTAPPDRPVTLDWPDTIRLDGARLGGGRLGWPDGCREDEVPAWLVFGATLIGSKRGAGDPGLTPDSTSLEEEGFEPGGQAALVEAFARHLMRGFDRWREEGFEAAAAGYLARLPRDPAGGRRSIDAAGNLVGGGRPHGTRALLPGLHAPSWLDPATGAPRL